METKTKSMEPSNKHTLELTTYTSFTYCDICKKLLWGVAKQGLTCTKCGMNVHDTCKDSLPSICVPNPEIIKANSSSSSLNGSKNSLSLSTTSSIIKTLQNNNLMMEASQKIHNTKTLVKDKIHQLNSSNEINHIISSQNSNSSSKSNSRDNSKENINNEINRSFNKNSTAGKLVLLSNSDDDSSNTSEITRKNKKKKLNKKKVSLDDKEDNSDTEVIKNDIDLVNTDVNNAMMFSEPENSTKLIRRKKNNDNNDNNDTNSNSDIQQNNNEINIVGNENSENYSKESSIKESNSEDNVEKILNETDNIDKDNDTLSETNISTPSITNFKSSDLTEIIKELPANSNGITQLKTLKSKPSQSEISSIVVTSTSNKNASIDSIINELDLNENETDKKNDNNDNDNNKEKKDSNKKKETVGFKISNSTSEGHEYKKEYSQKSKKKSKSMAALMKTNQVHSKLEELLKNDTFSFQSKLAEVENEPLSLFSTTPKNTIVFATKIGPVFDLQDKFMDILNWKNTSLSFSVYLIYSILCFQPNLILYMPVVSVVLFLTYIYYKRETGNDKNNNRNKEEINKNSNSKKEKEKIKDKDLKTNLNDLLSSLSVKQKANFNPNMVDMKTLQGNIQRLQNMMGSYCSAYDSVVEIWEKLNNTNPLEIRKAIFFSLLGLLGQIILLKFVRIGIIFFILGTFAFFPQFSIFIIWIFTGWLKIALEKFNDIIMRTQNNRSNSKLHSLGKKLIKPIVDNSSDDESNDYPSNSQRARLYSTLENNELKVQKSVENGSTQKVMEGKIFTAIVVENQRWWVGTGFTDLLLHNDPPNYSTNYKEPKEALPSSLDNYPLPPNYRFLPDESWEIEMDHGGDEEGWIYMDNIWRREGPRKITSYTRKRIWKRKASFYS